MDLQLLIAPSPQRVASLSNLRAFENIFLDATDDHTLDCGAVSEAPRLTSTMKSLAIAVDAARVP